jgi:hypothetical protein
MGNKAGKIGKRLSIKEVVYATSFLYADTEVSNQIAKG